MARSFGKGLSKQELVDAFERLSLPSGGLLMVHSALSSIGSVDGSASTVVEALMEVLGSDGTLVAPAFTYHLANDEAFIFDSDNTSSGSGAISEAVRKLPNALRSIHPRHSITAVGPLAKEIVNAGTGSAWELDSPMGQVIQRDGMVLMLGVSYLHLTLGHVVEVDINVPYRTEMIAERRMRLPNGSLVPLKKKVHPPVDWIDPKNDFNRLGQGLEDRGLVSIGQVGNAITRLLRAKDVLEIGREMYQDDPKVFMQQDNEYFELAFGNTVWMSGLGTVCVYDINAFRQQRTISS